MIDFNEAFDQGMKELRKRMRADVQDAAMKKVARVSSAIIKREMRGAGIRSSEATGTALGRSPSQRAKVEKEGSILDLDHKVESYPERDIAFAGHALHKGAYRARFQDDGTEDHYLWDSSKTRRMEGSPNYQGKGYLANARRIIEQEAKSIVKKAMRSAMRKVKAKKHIQKKR